MEFGGGGQIGILRKESWGLKLEEKKKLGSELEKERI